MIRAHIYFFFITAHKAPNDIKWLLSYSVHAPVLKLGHFPLSPFLLVQNLSSKWIAPTDNMRPIKQRQKVSSWFKG